MNIKILIDRSEPEFGGWKVMEKRRGDWVTAFRGTMDECHDWAQGAVEQRK